MNNSLIDFSKAMGYSKILHTVTWLQNDSDKKMKPLDI